MLSAQVALDHRIGQGQEARPSVPGEDLGWFQPAAAFPYGFAYGRVSLLPGRNVFPESREDVAARGEESGEQGDPFRRRPRCGPHGKAVQHPGAHALPPERATPRRGWRAMVSRMKLARHLEKALTGRREKPEFRRRNDRICPRNERCRLRRGSHRSGLQSALGQ